MMHSESIDDIRKSLEKASMTRCSEVVARSERMTSFWKRHHSKAIDIRKTNAFRSHHSTISLWKSIDNIRNTENFFHRCFFRVMLSMLLFDAFSDVIDAFSDVYPKSSSKVRKTPSKLPFSWKIMSFSNFVFVICELKCRNLRLRRAGTPGNNVLFSNCAGPDTFRPRRKSRRKSAKCPDVLGLKLVGNQF